MKLLTQEEGAQLKPGDVVNVYWFTPRKPKTEPTPESREWDGRTEWVENVWREQVVDSEPRMTPSDGWVVKLKRGCLVFCVSRMEKA